MKIGMIPSQAKECLGLPEAGRGKEGSFCQRFQQEGGLPTPSLGLLTSGTVRQ